MKEYLMIGGPYDGELMELPGSSSHDIHSYQVVDGQDVSNFSTYKRRVITDTIIGSIVYVYEVQEEPLVEILLKGYRAPDIPYYDNWLQEVVVIDSISKAQLPLQDEKAKELLFECFNQGKTPVMAYIRVMSQLGVKT